MTDTLKLKSDGKVFVSYPATLRKGVREAMASWQAFCALPEHVKLRFPYEPDTKQSGNGYELKKECGALLDRKEDFHLRLAANDELIHHALAVGSGTVERFVQEALMLPNLIEPLLVEFAQSLEKQYGIPGFAQAIADSKSQWLLRFLHYFGECSPGEEIAVPHIDKGGFTLHLYESDTGVEYLAQDKRTWIPMPLAHDETVIFPALGLQQYLKNEVKALCHRVVATDTCARKGRYSAVCFIDFAGAPHYDKARHGRLQAFPQGFNYDMPWEEFRNLFVPS